MHADVELAKERLAEEEDDSDSTYLSGRAKHIYGQMYRLGTQSHT